jgi:pantetheine-phosphate adenylyltransferase
LRCSDTASQTSTATPYRLWVGPSQRYMWGMQHFYLQLSMSQRKLWWGSRPTASPQPSQKNMQSQPFEERERDIRNFLSERGWLDRARIVRLDDPYGPTVEDPTIEALVVSPSTSHRAVEINAKRVERNMKPLEVVVCPLVVAEDGLPVSTTRIMNGEITPEGKVVRKAKALGKLRPETQEQ